MLAGDSDDPHIAAYAYGAKARILIFEGRVDEAIHVLSMAPDAGLTGTVAELLTYRGPRGSARGAVEPAARHVAEAEKLSRSNEVRVLAGSVRAICALRAQSPETPALLRAAIESIDSTGWTDRFITAYRAVPELLAAVAASPEWNHLAHEAVRLGRDSRLARRVGVGPDQDFTGLGLTRREHEVLALLADGLTNDEIARRLFIGVTTVKAHVRHILEKLGVRTRTQAALRRRADRPAGLSHGQTRHYRGWRSESQSLSSRPERYRSSAPARIASNAATTLVSNCDSTA